MDDDELYDAFRFRRHELSIICDELADYLMHVGLNDMHPVGYGFIASGHVLIFMKFHNFFWHLADGNGLRVGFNRETPL